ASCGSVRRMWNASRWAVRGPMPGSFASSVISRWTGAACTLEEARRSPSQAGQPEPAEATCKPPELRLGELLRAADRLVGGGRDHVLEQLGIVGIDRVGVDRDGLHLKVTRDAN